MPLDSTNSFRQNDPIGDLLAYAKNLREEYRRPPSERHHSLQAGLRHVGNHIKRIDDNIKGNSDHLEIAKSCLPSLEKISKNSNPRSFLRLKDGTIKAGHEPGDIRNFLFWFRYRKEQGEAARRLGLDVHSIRSGESKLMMEKKINWLRNDTKRLLECKNVFALLEAEINMELKSNEGRSDSSTEGSARIDERLLHRNK